MSSCAQNQNDTAECRTAHRDYDSAYLEFIRLSGSIQESKDLRLSGGGIVAVGLVVGAIPVVGWVIGLSIAGFGAGVALIGGTTLSARRRLCFKQIQKMHAAAAQSGGVCETEACKIKRPEVSCP